MFSDVEFPEKLAALFMPRRYKILYGGRGGAKSWGVARALLTMGSECRLKILCCREFQNSIKESVHQLLSDQITRLGLEEFYKVQTTSIVGRNGTEFSFEGLRHNATKIKSYEGVDIAWVEQGERVRKSSWEILIPTIRKDNSEIWVTLNPELEEDDSYQRFVKMPPPDSLVIKLDWRDNPWFPAVLRSEMEDLQRRDPDAWLNIWEGHCRVALEGAIYANELREAQQEGRICRVPYDRSQPVHTAWDLGHSDATSIWCVQRVGFDYRFINYIEGVQHHLAHYLVELQSLGYVWGTDYLPHDGRNATLAARSIEDQMKAAGRSVVIVPRTPSVSTDINAVRTLFPHFWFDAESCADGLHALRHYRYGVDEDTLTRTRLPLHDPASHGADALRTFVLGFKAPSHRRAVQERPRLMTVPSGPGTEWMGA